MAEAAPKQGKFYLKSLETAPFEKAEEQVRLPDDDRLDMGDEPTYEATP